MHGHDVVSYGVGLAACGPLAGLVFWWGRRRAHRAATAAAARWEQILAAARLYPDVRLGQVVTVYQRARTGTKAWVRWHGATTTQDVWFRGVAAIPGTWYLVIGFDRYGPHRHEPHLYDVTDVVMSAPAAAHHAWLHRQSQSGESGPDR